VSISPRLGPIGWFDFQRAAEAIKIGADAIDQINEAVAALSHPVTANTAPK
jgi:NTE family protein